MDGIKIGRISRKVEKALGTELGKDIFLYVGNARLDELAKSRGDRYLKDLEELSKVIAAPDYVSYWEDGGKAVLSFVREYVKGPSFKKIEALFVRAQRWELAAFGLLREEEARLRVAKAPFRKVE